MKLGIIGLPQSGKTTIYNALTTDVPAADPKPYVIGTGVDRLSLIPADRNLTGAEIEMVPRARREERLRLLRAAARAADMNLRALRISSMYSNIARVSGSVAR